MLTEPAGN